MPITENRAAFISWLATYEKDRGLYFSQMGKKSSPGDNHEIDLSTGYWIKPSYSGSKPIRWVINIDSTHTPFTASVPTHQTGACIGHSNTSKGNVGAIMSRVLPVIMEPTGSYFQSPSWEFSLVFCFASGVQVGGAAETFNFDPTSGTLTYLDKNLPYIFCALIGVFDRSDITSNGSYQASYGDVFDATASMLKAHTPSGLAPMLRYDLTQVTELTKLKKDVELAYSLSTTNPTLSTAVHSATITNSDEDDDEGPDANNVPENADLLGVETSVYRQINAALASGKQHLMLYGPPGTGKTTLARHIAQSLSPSKWTLITGSADWSSQDIIGGYQPVGSGEVAFQSGVLLRNFDQPLIIDEMNRCDIDKVLGPLFTVLSGQHTTLPYRVVVSDPNSAQYTILPVSKTSPMDNEYAPGKRWRLIATINSIDKASLYQMSYALARRFGWIYVDIPSNLENFIHEFITRLDGTPPLRVDGSICPLANIWVKINEIRPIGPAAFIDCIKVVRSLVPGADFFTSPTDEFRAAMLDAFDMVLLPMLDGIVILEARSLATSITGHLELTDNQQNRISARLSSVAV